MAPYSMVLLGALSILGFGAYAQEAAVEEPQIFFNLTYTEYLDKVAASHGSSQTSDLPWNDTMSGFPGNETGSSLSRRGRIVNLGKRDPVGGESFNDHVTNDMLQALHSLCVGNFGTGFRATSGYCRPNRRATREIQCARPDTTGAGSITRACPRNQECTTFVAHNFRSQSRTSDKSTFPVCGPRIDVTERHDIGIHTEWDGIWYPESPKSPGTYDSFVQMAGSLNGYFDFQGTYSNGEGMSSRGNGHSWSCINCPGGKLTITSTNRPTWAIGYTSPY
uniref:Secreted in xylem 1 n=1 Tax=Fusarium oxysporum f. sp. cubense TaxID=61366 RepID=A0A240FGK9_FUSOC|nr:secreted in xylem 1 [Fusarium oxysporum f. sp. cubense]